MGIPASRGLWVQALQAGSQGNQVASRNLQRWPQEIERAAPGTSLCIVQLCPSLGRTCSRGEGNRELYEVKHGEGREVDLAEVTGLECHTALDRDPGLMGEISS